MNDIAAVIMAGGTGSRLAPFTLVLPKPLVPLGDTPIVELMLRRMMDQGIKRAVFSLGHMADVMLAYISQLELRLPGIEVAAVREDAPLGTAGPLRLASDLVGSDFLVTNGDLLTDIDYRALVKHHRESDAMLTIGAYEKHTQLGLGVLVLDADGRVIDYVEKPTYEHTVSMGIYVYRREAIGYIREGERIDFNDLVCRLVAGGERVVAFPFAGTWLDIGRPEDYALAVEEFEREPGRFLPEGDVRT